MDGLFPHLRLQNYRIVSRLGAGGMGEVYLAHDSEGSFYMIHLKVEPILDSVRGDPRFADIVRRVGHLP